jgi:predicted dehydrogenase
LNRLIRWGIWGTGNVAHLVASDFRLVSEAVLHAVASRTVERAQRFAARHGVARCYVGLEALLNDAEVDVVYIATPNYRHVDDCLACIKAGKPVLCEKPFALNLSQAQQIVDAARRHKVFCMEAMWTRFIPAVIEAKRCVESGAIGSIRMIQGNFAYPVPSGCDGRFFDPELGGGALLDRGVYLISLAQQLLGVPQSIRGSACLGATGADEQSAYQFVYACGALADMAASLRVRGTNEVIVFGERGLVRLCEPFYRADRLVLQSFACPRAVAQEDSLSRGQGARRIVGAVRDAPATKLFWRRLSPLLTVLSRGRVRTFPFAGNGYQFELRHVDDCLRERHTESAIMPLKDSLDVMRTMDALRSQMGLDRAGKIGSDLQLSAI